VGTRFSARPDRPWGPPRLLYNGYRVFPGGKVRPVRAADHSPPSSAAVMEEQSYTSTHPLGHTGPVTGSLYLYWNCLPACNLSYLTESEVVPEHAMNAYVRSGTAALIHPYPRQYRQVSGQPHDQPPYPSIYKQEAKWAPETFWTYSRRDLSSCRDWNPYCTAYWLPYPGSCHRKYWHNSTCHFKAQNFQLK